VGSKCKLPRNRSRSWWPTIRPFSRKLVEYALSEKQYSLIFAKSGRETIELFAEQHPAVVIADWMMPDLIGIEICQQIRSRSPAFYIYIILLTGKSAKESVVEGLVAGAPQVAEHRCA